MVLAPRACRLPSAASSQLTYCVLNATQVRGRRRRDAADRKGRRLGFKYHHPVDDAAPAAARILLLVWWGLLFTAWAPYIRRARVPVPRWSLVLRDPAERRQPCRSTKIPPLVAFCSRWSTIAEATLLAALPSR